jgi:formate hydrogenlyase transcriptional activator
MSHDAIVSASNTSFSEQLRETLHAVPTHAWYATPSGTLIFLNEKAADYGGLPKDHPLRLGIDTGAPWDSHVQFLHPDDQDETRRVWSHCLETGTAGEVSFRARDAHGSYHWFASRAEPTRASDGTLLYWTGVNVEIEGHKQAEFYLKEAQRLAHVGSWAFSASGFGHWSSQLFEIHGLEPGKPPSIPEYLDLVHPEDRGFVTQAIQRMLSDQREFDFTKRIVRPDGVIRHVRCVGVPLGDGATFQGFAGTGIDVTEQEQLTEELRRSELELRRILDLTPQLIAVFGPRRERLYLNQMSLDYFGFNLDEWRVAPPGPDIHPDDTERLRSQWDRAIASASAFEIEVRFRRSDGVYRWFLIRCNPVCDAQGKVLHWYAACTDIEDRKGVEEGLRQENTALRAQIGHSSIFEEIVGSSEPLRKVLAHVGKVAPTDSTVLILGETGTGKELVARAIHRRSKRAARVFAGVNCGAIPASLIASELFGHEKGAFTGATQRRLGRFEAANGGTLFLDEVGDLPHDIQIALLRVLQEREIQRVGGDKPIPVDVRVLAATHRDLEKLVSEGKFREDLFYRLNVVPLTMPPLRARVADIPMLVQYFIARFEKRGGKRFDSIEKATMEMLRAYSWPGNVRELENVIERAVILSDTETFRVDEAWLARRRDVHQTSAALGDMLEVHAKEAIEAALADCRGRLSGPSGAAAKLGVPTSTLVSKIKRLGIDTYRFKSQDATPQR